MHCSDVRTALSARIDGEAPPPGVSGPALETHVRGCADCHRWDQRARRLKVLAARLGVG